MENGKLRIEYAAVAKKLYLRVLSMPEGMRGKTNLNPKAAEQKFYLHSRYTPAVATKRTTGATKFTGLYLPGEDRTADNNVITHEFKDAANLAQYVAKLAKAVAAVNATLAPPKMVNPQGFQLASIVIE